MGDTASVPLVIISDGSERVLPIFIGIWEAVSINSAKNKEVTPRPFTHDLFLDLIAKFSITLRSLQIDSIEDGVYYAKLVFSSDHREEYLDCRPSDGIAVALRGNVPIFVEDTVLASAGKTMEDLPVLIDLETFLNKLPASYARNATRTWKRRSAVSSTVRSCIPFFTAIINSVDSSPTFSSTLSIPFLSVRSLLVYDSGSGLSERSQITPQISSITEVSMLVFMLRPW
jgi:bifunctional DNase/RNase